LSNPRGNVQALYSLQYQEEIIGWTPSHRDFGWCQKWRREFLGWCSLPLWLTPVYDSHYQIRQDRGFRGEGNAWSYKLPNRRKDPVPRVFSEFLDYKIVKLIFLTLYREHTAVNYKRWTTPWQIKVLFLLKVYWFHLYWVRIYWWSILHFP